MLIRTCSILAVLFTCSACATVPAAAPTPIVTVKTVCLPLKAYSLTEQQAIAAELSALPPGSHLAGFVADYAAMRDADRACAAQP